MSSYKLNRNINIDDSWDVVVIGGGPAGCTAAAASAREGARTLLIESTGVLGGMGTSGLVPAWCPFSDKQGNVLYRGLAERVFRESRKGVPHVSPDQLDWAPINPEQLKRVYDDLVTESGAMVLFNTFASAVETDGHGTVEALIISNKAGLTALKAKTYVDCSGDADIAAWAGAEFHKGDETTGELQPSTHCFIISNVNQEVFDGDHHKVGMMRQIVESGKYPLIRDGHFCRSFIGPNTMGFNAGHLWGIDNTDPENISRAMMEGRKLAEQLHRALVENWPESFGESFLVTSGSLMGIRETRRIVGDYYLLIEDYIARKSFSDEICRNNYWIDVHTGKNEIARANAGEKVCMERYQHYGPGESHGIPYRCLTPKGLSNVITAGRAISCDHAVQGSVRVMPVCLAMGEAAGLGAAMAAASVLPDVHAVDVQGLRRRLREYGQYLPEVDTVTGKLTDVIVPRRTDVK